MACDKPANALSIGLSTAKGTEDSADEFDNESTSHGSNSTLTHGGQTSRSNTPTLTSRAGGGSAQGLKKSKKRKKMSKVYTSSGRFTMVCVAREDHGHPIFGCQFNTRLKDGEPLILATVGSNRVSIYECCRDGKLKILQVYADPDAEERFYCCAWTDDGKSSLLAVAGSRGIIRIFSPTKAACVKHFLGHGNAVNDLVFHPGDSNLLLSASKDHSLRLWNIKTDYCVAIFGGVEGHRDEVLAADIKMTGSYIISCGMDHALKVWKLKKPEIEKAIALSYTFNPRSTNRPFPTIKENFPEFSTRDIHRNYVDSTKWNGDFVFSKSCENNIVCWKAGRTFQTWDEISTSTTETSVIHRLDITDCDIWFMRFSLDYKQNNLALGNLKGKTFVYDLTSVDPTQITHTVLSHPKCNAAIRQTAFSRDGNVLVCVCDDATIWRWDTNESAALATSTAVEESS